MITDINARSRDSIALAQLDADLFAKLHDDLARLPLAIETTDEVVELLHNYALFEDNGTGAGDFILFALYQLADRNERSVSHVIEEMIADASAEISDPQLDSTILENLRGRVGALSRLNNVVLSIKASLLIIDRAKLLMDSKIFTDLRPIAEEDSATPALLILNTLKLGYRENEQLNTIYVALDDRDIEGLITQLQLAQQKACLLKEALRASNTRIVE
jgi:hypothetical protein